ncbi:MAG: hypothetical protein WCC41_12755 [Rhodomicrobium sp.]
MGASVAGVAPRRPCLASHEDLRCLKQASPIWPPDCLPRRRSRRAFGKPFVATPGFNTKVVNRSAPDLFPVMSLVRIWFTAFETEERRAFDWARVIYYKALKMLDILSLTNCPLN